MTGETAIESDYPARFKAAGGTTEVWDDFIHNRMFFSVHYPTPELMGEGLEGNAQIGHRVVGNSGPLNVLYEITLPELFTKEFAA